jgi:threonine dehydratase
MATRGSVDSPPVSLADIHDAADRISATMRPSPLLMHPLLAKALDADVYVKHENHNPTGAFKVRGGLNLVGSLKDDLRSRGVITASTGNHGQSIAFACHRESIPCTVYVPVGNNPDKNAAMRAWGATVVEHGRDFDEAREAVEREAASGTWRYIHSANEPLLVAGVATLALELFTEVVPDVVFVPIGGGSGAMGLCLVRSALGLPTRVVGIQAGRADAFARSWRTGTRQIGSAADTFAEGMATRVTFDLTFDYLERELDDIITLTEDELAEGVRMAIHLTHNLAEGAGAASLAAAAQRGADIRGKTVACVMTGGNIDGSTLKRILALPPQSPR